MILTRPLVPLAACILVVASFSGCSKSDSSSTTAVARPEVATISLAEELGVDLPSQEEADARAAAEITAENADQVFAELEKEAAAEP